MSLPVPISQINEFSCGLASYCYLRAVIGRPTTQQDLLANCAAWFPGWKEKPGALSVGDMINLVGKQGPGYRRFILSDQWDHIETAASHFGQDAMAGGFIFLKNSTFHCFALLAPTKDQDGKVLVMIPDPPAGILGKVAPEEVSRASQSDFLLFFR